MSRKRKVKRKFLRNGLGHFIGEDTVVRDFLARYMKPGQKEIKPTAEPMPVTPLLDEGGVVFPEQEETVYEESLLGVCS